MLLHLRRLFRRFTARSCFDRDLSDELRDHLERRTADLVRAGLSPDEARRRAHVEFGGLEGYKEQIRDEGGWAQALRNLPEQMWREFVLALRRLRAAKAFTVFSIVSLAVGVGVTTAIYSLMYGMLWRPLAVADVDRLAYVTAASGWNPGVTRLNALSRADFEDLCASQTAFAHLAAWVPGNHALLTDDIAEVVPMNAVSGGYFETVGVGATIGRVLVPDDDRADAAAVVVLGESFWRTRLKADPTVVGRTVRLGGIPFVVAGVAAASFRGLDGHSNVVATTGWITFSGARAMRTSTFVPARDDRAVHMLSVVGRLRPGGTRVAASSELAALGARLDAAYPWRVETGRDRIVRTVPRTWSAIPIGGAMDDDGRVTRLASVLIGLVALVLMVACTNLANLMLARGAVHQKELAVRRALGASRGRLVRELLAEHAIIAAAGCGGAILITKALTAALLAQLPAGSGLPVDLDLSLNPAVVAAAAGAAVLSLVVFGLWPAWRLTAAEPRVALAAGGGANGTIRWRARRRLIAWQVAVSAGFFLGAAFCVKAVVANATYDPGVDVDRLAMAMVYFDRHQWDEARAMRSIDAILAGARQQPGVEAVAATTALPFSLTLTAPWADIGAPDGGPGRDLAAGHGAYMMTATPAIFQTLGVPIVRGRAFDARDDVASRPVVVISERTARTVFGSIDVVDRPLAIRGRTSTEQTKTLGTATVIGVARDTDTYQIGRRDNNLIYLPLAQRYDAVVFFVARAGGRPDPVVTTMRSVIRKADPDIAVTLASTGSVMMAGLYLILRAIAVVATGLGAVAAVLAMAGLYGVLSQLVVSRTREMGIRIALGADARRIRRLVLRDGFRPVVTGLVLGLGVGVIVRLVMRASVVGAGTSFIDPVTFSLAPLPLVVCAWIACYLPARRASRVDPNVALRDQ